MSVKFEKDTIKQTGGVAGTQGAPAIKSGKHELADEIGTALTGGKGNAGTKGYLAVRVVVSRDRESWILCRVLMTSSCRHT